MCYIQIMIILQDETWEFVAKIISDLGKAVLTVGFASYFFEKLPATLRVGFIVAAVVFFVLSAIIIENKGGRK